MKYKFAVATAIVGGVFLLSNCSDKPKQETSDELMVSEDLNREGVSVFSQNCTSCHSTKEGVNTIAPSMVQLKKSYLNATENEDEFVDAMSHFLSAPSKERSKMPEALEQYALMPNLGFSVEQYRSVAAYIYHSDIENPNWTDGQYQKDLEQLKNAPKEEIVDYLKKGKELALSTKAVLGKNLLNAIQNKGTENALEFCTTRAIPLTDSMSVVLNASIKRVSDKNRNLNNGANQQELAYIAYAKKELEEGRTPAGKLTAEGRKAIGYYPIITNKMCLQCHGQTERDITPETLSMIQKLYPSDLATGYGENELRGIWVIEMDK
jgi:cytochrome c2